ncbi:MAG: N-acetyltransferase [Promethearchaeota archaeon]|nr:MAG: N-acetyltransferase [Candidatus Lokiarchaeota archaeon]
MDIKEEDVFPFISGEQIDLVAPNSNWANIYTKWKNDPEVRLYMRNVMPRTLESIKKRYEPQEGGTPEHIGFTIYHKKDKKPIGSVGLSRINWFNRWANAFALIGEKEYWGKDIATEAVKLILKYAFEELNLHKISGGAAINNIGSWTVAEKVGFTFEATHKDEFYVDGKYIDTKRYYFFKEDWMNKYGNK